MKKSTLLLLFLALSISSLIAQTSMYSFQRIGAGELAPTTLNIIDPVDGSLVQTIGPSGLGQITAIAVDPTTGKMYGTHGGGGCCPVAGYAGCLLEIDRLTGTATIVGCDPVYGGNDNLSALTFDSQGNLFGALLACNAGIADCNIYLVQVNKTTGAFAFVSASPTAEWCEGNGMGFGKDDILYYQNNCAFGSVDANTGVFDTIPATYTGFPMGTSNFRITDFTYDPSTETLYAAVSAGNGFPGVTSYLAEVDPVAGTVTHLGETPLHTASMTFGPSLPIPTMGQWALVIFGLIVLILGSVAIANSRALVKA